MSSLTEATSGWVGEWENPNPNYYRHPGDRFEIPDPEERYEGWWYIPEEQALIRMLKRLLRDKAHPSVMRDRLMRFVEKRMGGTPIFVPGWYGWVMIAGATSTMLMAWLDFVLWRARKINNVPDEVIQYPDSEMYTCASRAYLSTCEIYSNFLFALAVGGLENPKICGFCGFAWVLGRYWYARGYYKGRPSHRKNGSFYMFGHAGVIASMLLFTLRQMTPWNVHKTAL